MCSHCVFGSHLSTQAMSYDIIGAVEQARDVACIAYVHHGRKASLRKASLDIVALVGSSRCHKLQQHSWESALHARDAKKLLRAHTEKLKLGREADRKVKKFNDKIAIRHSDVINLSLAQKRIIVKGKGKYKSWTTGAVMRAVLNLHSCQLNSITVHAQIRLP